MDISKIKTPAFLKELNVRQLDDLSEQIRSYIMDQLSLSGGYLSSNLGVIEMTVALHYCFDAPDDRILFDIGHQCLTHLILTGRSDLLAPLYMGNRSNASLNRLQSVYDACDASHPASALSYALGIASARDLKEEKYHVVTLIGDRSFSSGLSLETLKQIGKQKRKMIIVLNDNGMTHFASDSLMSSNISKVRNSRVYNGLKDGVKSALKKGKYGEEVIGKIHDLKERIKEPLIDSRYLKDFGFYYIGPVDGHDCKSLVSAFETAKKKDVPVVVHCLTSKGKGYLPAEKDVSGKWDYVSAFDIKTGRNRSEVPEGEISCEEYASLCMEKEMDNDPNIVVISVGKNFESKLDGLFAKYPQRCFDAGLSADLAADLAAGLALNGMKPYISADSSFLGRAYDQLANDISGKVPVLFGISCHLDIDNGGNEPSDIRYLRTLSDSIIAQGKDASEIRSLIRCGFSYGKPFFIRYSRENIRSIGECDTKDIAIGKWEIINNLKEPELYIISCGVSVNRIAKTIADNELNYALINARFIRPLDEKMLKKVLSSGKRIYLYCAEESADLSEEIRLFAIHNELPCKVTEFGNCGCLASDGSASSDIRTLFERISNDKKQDK